jgi:IMP dehydrogenase
MATPDAALPRGVRIRSETLGPLRDILLGPSSVNDGTMNLFGALKNAMATTGYEDVKDFQKAEIVIAPALKTEGKLQQRQQGVGQGA